MERLLCEPEDRIGSEASSSVVRPNSLIMQERRSGFILPNVGKGKSVDGAEFIKVMLRHVIVVDRVPLSMTGSHRPTPGSEGLTGPTSIVRLRHTNRILALLRTLVTLTTTFPQRYGLWVSPSALNVNLNAQCRTYSL